MKTFLIGIFHRVSRLVAPTQGIGRYTQASLSINNCHVAFERRRILE